MQQIIRTKRDGCYGLASNLFGCYIAKIDDPEGVDPPKTEDFSVFKLHDDLSRLPAQLWHKWIQLCFEFCGKDRGNLEVSCRLLQRLDDKSQWKIVIPRQRVSGGSVDTEDFHRSIDIDTGETHESYPPAGWRDVGSSH